MSQSFHKIVIIGAGHVGSHCAQALIMAGLVHEIVLLDVDSEKANAQAEDLTDLLMFAPHCTTVRAGGYETCDDAQMVIVAAGVPRKPGQSRLDTLSDSIQVMKDIVPKLNATAFNGLILCISNPVDVITTYFLKHSNLPAHRIFGTGTSLDTARLKRVLWKALNIHPSSLQCMVLGEHGDSSMIPFSHVQVSGIPLNAWLGQNQGAVTSLNFQEVLNRTQMAGMDIINGKGSTEFGIGAVVADLVGAILFNEKRIFPLSTLLSGEYGQRDLAIGVPALLGCEGIESVFEMNFTEEETQRFAHSCQVVRNHWETVKDV